MLKSLKLRRKLLSKVFIAVVLIYMLYAAASQSLTQPLVNQYKLRMERQVKFEFNKWYNNFLASNHKLENNPKFSKELEAIRKEKLQNDWSNELWDMNPKILADLPLDVTIPDYYFKGGKPIAQPFDPRFTFAIYISWISQNKGKPVPFHWSDWVDLSKLDKYILSKKKEKPNCKQLFDAKANGENTKNTVLTPVQKYCRDDPKSLLGYTIFDFSGPQTVENHEILSKSHLYTGFESPYKIIFLTDNKGLYEVNVQNTNNDLKYSLLKNKMVEKVISKLKLKQGSKLNPVQAYKKLVKTTPTKNSYEVMSKYQVDIPRDAFNTDNKVTIKELEQKRRRSILEENYLKSLKFSEGTDNPPKFFKECKLLKSHPQSWIGEHYDWRFFNGLTIGDNEQLLSLHRLVKTYFNFARQHGIITWIAHGTLLSWYWNGIAFPWDTDIDVQMPITELHRLSRRFNQTLVVENIANNKFEFNGMGKYFIDVGSSITHRSKGNGNNNIDGRFIDVDTGLYIDITALALTETPAPSRYDYLLEIDPDKQEVVRQNTDEVGNVNHWVKNQQIEAYACRNNHFSTYDELSPLLLSGVENQLSYVPSNFMMTLDYEYGLKGLTEKNFKDYIYLNNFRIWIKTQDILDYLNDPERWIMEHNLKLNNPDSSKKTESKKPKNEKRVVGNLEKLSINQLTVQDHINLLQSSKIFKEYFKSRKFTEFHEAQIRELSRANAEDSEAEQILHQYMDEIGNSLRGDLFMSKLFKNGWNYEEEVKRMTGLSKIYAS